MNTWAWRWTHESCTADFGVGSDFATLFFMESTEKNKGHAQALLKHVRRVYTSEKKDFGGSVALSSAMKHIYKKLKITEYE